MPGIFTANLTTLWTTLTDFERATGLRLNWEKSSIYPLHPNTPHRVIRLGDATLAWTGDPPRYLGIRLYQDSQDLLEENHLRALRGLKNQISFWRTLPLAPIGRVALSKMIMVPRLLYYLANIPVIPPRSFFQELNSLLISLIWRKGRCRVALSTLQLPRDKGGMGAPSFEAYFLAAQLQ